MSNLFVKFKKVRISGTTQFVPSIITTNLSYLLNAWNSNQVIDFDRFLVHAIFLILKFNINTPIMVLHNPNKNKVNEINVLQLN